MGNVVVGTPKVNAKVDTFANSFKIGVNPFPAKDLRHALFEKTIQPLKQFSLSGWDYHKALALLTGFVLAQVNKNWGNVEGTEVAQDWDIPGQEGWVFHHRLDVVVGETDYGRQVWDYKTVSVPSQVSILDDRRYSLWLSDLREYYSHDAQVNYYARSNNVDTLVIFQLVKAPIKKGKQDTPESLGQKWLDFYVQHPSRCFVPLLVVPSYTHEVDWELFDIVNRIDYIREGKDHTRAIKNRKACKGCPFFGVCTNRDSLDDPELFTEKPQAVDGGKYLSVSQINVFHECERKWHHMYESRKQPKGKDMPWLEFGKAVHDCLEQYGNMINEVQAQEVAK